MQGTPVVITLARCLILVILLVSGFSAAAGNQTVKSGEWRLISLPGSTTKSVSTLFDGVLSANTINTTWFVFTYDTSAGVYRRLGSDDQIASSQAFWFIQNTGQPVTFDLPMLVETPDLQKPTACTSTRGCAQHTISASNGTSWTMVGIPFKQDIPVSQLSLSSTSGVCTQGCTMAEARAAGLSNGIFYEHDAAANSFVEISAGGSLKPGAGYWLAVQLNAGDEATLLIPSQAPLPIDMALVDDAMTIPVPYQAGSYAGAGNYYGRNAAVMLFLTLLAHDDPTKIDSSGVSVMARALQHLQAAVSVETHPLCRGGHVSWFDMFVPIALGIARQTPAMWDTFTNAARTRADLLMRHCLHTANIFINTNSANNDRSGVFVDMHLLGSGSLPNQSASFHAYGIGAYLYFGGEAGMTAALASYNVDSFRTQLRNVGFEDIAQIYDNPTLQRLLEGETISPRVSPDPLGVRKPLRFLNTLSLDDSLPGTEHPYNKSYPIAATPTGIFQRWGHEFTVGAMPRGNVGPSLKRECGGVDFGLAKGTMPYENSGKGMPYEFNARSSASGAPTRTAWDYANWSMQQYAYLFSALSITGYWDTTNPQHQEIVERARRAIEIWRYVGENKWLSNLGPASQICTTAHGDAYGVFGGSHWAHGMIDALFTEPGYFTYAPLVP